MHIHRQPLHFLCLLLLLALALPSLGLAAVPGLSPGSPGTITITEKKLEPAQANSLKDLKAEQRSVLGKAPEAEGWQIHLVAHLNRPPGAEEVNIVFYDQTPPKPGQPREPINAYPIHTKKDGKVMLAQVEVRPEDGFKAGGKYLVLITRLINGKEDVYAKTTLELK